MKRLSCFILSFGIGVVALACLISPAVAQIPNPKDEAKLYDLAKKEGTVVWYGAAPLEMMKDNAKDFEVKYPGVKVEILRYAGPKQYQRFLHETNANQHIADILYLSDYASMKSLIQQNHIADWKVPTSDRIPLSFRMGNYSYAPYTADIVIAYNINKVTPEEVKILDSSWKGVLDPRFKGRFAVAPYKCGTCYGGVHMFMDPKYAKVYGPEFFKAVAAQKPTPYPDAVVMLDRVVAGEHDFTFWSWEATVYLKWLQGAPIRWVHPDPTPEWGNAWYGISKYAPHPNAARLFLSWTTSDSGALSFQRVGAKPSLEGFKDTRKVVNEPWYDPIKTRYEFDYGRWEKSYNAEMDLWIKTIMEGR